MLVGLGVVLVVAAWMGAQAAAVADGPAGSTAPTWAARYPNEYSDWQDSVHGAAYLNGNTDVPGCPDCHGDPASEDLESASFRLDIPARCARCHADPKLMSKYGLPSDTYASYVAEDYHGKTIEFARATSSSEWRYEAVCSDCHSAHAIYAPDDARSTVAPANLLNTCQKCHLSAGPGFTAIASGHFHASQAKSLLVYLVSLAYRILIPLVIGLMLAYIGLDIVHRVRSRVGRKAA